MKKLIAVMAVAGLAAGCTTDPYTGQQKVSNTALGTALGAGVGALAGAAVGGSKVAQRNAILIGAGIGALAGAGIGNYMDQQEAELRAQLRGTGVSVTRVGDDIILNMPSNITFATDQDQVQPSFYQTLNSVAIVLQKFNRTLVDVYGHTDSTGDDQYNLALSQRRASSVADYLSGRGVDDRRFYIAGLGESQPVASNATPDGRALNRRVEIKLVPITEQG
ncbi:cell envelope biogenesis protein OmpA [Zhengella mangrovi]|uniref:Cell envelope biogenesis protein OmpA n=1 Tax=Zhengella mangrovi TaxID=1982044 RepID=A0A2G1QP02_9HYPH|nr:OmpA family protein [Zhengella mangrovi]PHP67277.1 cell envelope biogenesis protein OmpA [Zhengella mangrovi]